MDTHVKLIFHDKHGDPDFQSAISFVPQMKSHIQWNDVFYEVRGITYDLDDYSSIDDDMPLMVRVNAYWDM